MGCTLSLWPGDVFTHGLRAQYVAWAKPAATEVKRGEPDASMFQILSKYKVVDETSPPPEPRAQ